jgi:hypothetical protein
MHGHRESVLCELNRTNWPNAGLFLKESRSRKSVRWPVQPMHYMRPRKGSAYSAQCTPCMCSSFHTVPVRDLVLASRQGLQSCCRKCEHTRRTCTVPEDGRVIPSLPLMNCPHHVTANSAFRALGCPHRLPQRLFVPRCTGNAGLSFVTHGNMWSRVWSPASRITEHGGLLASSASPPRTLERRMHKLAR